MYFINLSKILPKLSAVLLCAAFVLTVGAQLVMTRYHNDQIVVSEGLHLGGIKLSLDGIAPNKKIKVLQNGYPIGEFHDREIYLQVNDNSLIEIDGTSVKKPFSVKLVEADTNTEVENPTQVAHVNQNIATLTKIFIK